MLIRITPARRVSCKADIHLPLPASAVWGQLRDFHTYASHDYFHRRIEIAGGIPRSGAQLRLQHGYLGFRVMRTGRLLWWKEGQGYAFSDLSLRGPRHGFPHVLSFRISPIGDASLLQIRVGGRWTLKGPRWIGRLWLWWVFSHVVNSVQNELLAFVLFRGTRRSPPLVDDGDVFASS